MCATVTSLDVREIDRQINGQHFGGVGLRWAPLRGPGLTIELRNHHISNAGTVGENLGVNAGTIVAGMQWILRRSEERRVGDGGGCGLVPERLPSAGGEGVVVADDRD